MEVTKLGLVVFVFGFCVSFVALFCVSTWHMIIFTTPTYLHNLTSLHCTCSSSVVTLSQPPTISSLKMTDQSFRCASPRHWNQLSDSFHQPHLLHLSSHHCHHYSHHLLFPYFLLSAQILSFQQILTIIDFWYCLDCLRGSLDWTRLIVLIGFLVLFS